MPWLLFALAVGCFAIAFRTHSMALAAITLLAALGLMLAAVLALASARIARNSRSETAMMSPEEMRLIAENMRRKREQETGGAATAGVVLAATAGQSREPDAGPDAGNDSGGSGGSD